MFVFLAETTLRCLSNESGGKECVECDTGSAQCACGANGSCNDDLTCDTGANRCIVSTTAPSEEGTSLAGLYIFLILLALVVGLGALYFAYRMWRKRNDERTQQLIDDAERQLNDKMKAAAAAEAAAIEAEEAAATAAQTKATESNKASKKSDKSSKKHKKKKESESESLSA